MCNPVRWKVFLTLEAILPSLCISQHYTMNPKVIQWIYVLQKNACSTFHSFFPLDLPNIQTLFFFNLRFRDLDPEGEENRGCVTDLQVLTHGSSQWRFIWGPGGKSRDGWTDLSCEMPTSQFQCCDSTLLHSPGSSFPPVNWAKSCCACSAALSSRALRALL